MVTTHSLLGATGRTGSAVLRHLLSQPPQDIALNIYVRNKAKLLKAFPDLEAAAAAPFPVQIYEGSNTDVSVLKKCFQNTQVIYMCLATNVAKKGDALFTDTASAIVDALKSHQAEQGPSYHTPTLLILRSISLNPDFNQEFSGLAPKIVWFVLDYVYNNMIDAGKIYEASVEEHPGLLEYIYVDPPAIHDADGTETTGYEFVPEPKKDISHVISYADLGKSFCEVAERRAEFKGKGVVVVGTGKINLTWGSNMSQLWLNMRAKVLGW